MATKKAKTADKAKSSVRRRSRLVTGSEVPTHGVPGSEQDPRRRLGNFGGAGEHAARWANVGNRRADDQALHHGQGKKTEKETEPLVHYYWQGFCTPSPLSGISSAEPDCWESYPPRRRPVLCIVLSAVRLVRED